MSVTHLAREVWAAFNRDQRCEHMGLHEIARLVYRDIFRTEATKEEVNEIVKAFWEAWDEKYISLFLRVQEKAAADDFQEAWDEEYTSLPQRQEVETATDDDIDGTDSPYYMRDDLLPRQDVSSARISHYLKTVWRRLSQIGVAKYAQPTIIDLLSAVGTGEYHDITNRASAIRLIMIVIREASRLASEAGWMGTLALAEQIRNGVPSTQNGEPVDMIIEDLACQLATIAKDRQDNNYRFGQFDNSARLLAASSDLAGLTSLTLQYDDVGPDGAKAIAKSKNVGRLTKLNLCGNKIGDAGAQALASSAYLIGLKILKLANCEIGPDGAVALAASKGLANLVTLDLRGNHAGVSGAQAIASSPHFARLTTLNLDGNMIGKEGALALARSQQLTQLTTLTLAKNGIRSRGKDALQIRFGNGVSFG